jgi:hypothetical protein
MTGEVCDALGSPFESLDLWNILIPLSGNAAGSRRSCGRARTIIADRTLFRAVGGAERASAQKLP